MNNFKKILTFSLLTVSLVGFTACSDKDDDPRPTNEDTRVTFSVIENKAINENGIPQSVQQPSEGGSFGSDF